MKEIIFLLLLFLIATSLGSKILKWAKVRIESFFHYLFALGLGLGVLSYLIFIIGWWRKFYFYPLFFLLVTLTIISGDELVKLFQLIYYKGKSLYYSKNLEFIEIILLIFIFLFLIFNLVFALSPSIYWDELHYHLTVPYLYLKNHAVVRLPQIPYSHFPQVVEMLFTLGMGILNDKVPALIHYSFGMLLLLTIYAAGVIWGNRKIGLLAVTIVLTTPTFNLLLNIAYVDLGFTFYLLITFFSFLLWCQTKKEEYLALSAIFAGLTTGIKYSGLIAVLLLGVGIILSGLYPLNISLLKKALYYGIISIIVCSPWFLRNIIWTNNPVYPFFYNLFGGVDLSPEISQRFQEEIMGFGGVEKNLKNIILLPFKITFEGKYFAGISSPLYLGFLPALILLFPNKMPYVRLLLAFVIIYFLFWGLTSHQFRFLIPAFATYSLIIAYIVINLKNDWFKNLVYFFLFFSFSFSLFLLIAVHKNKIPVALGWQEKTRYLEKHLDLYSVFQWTNQVLLPGEKVYLVNDNRGYYLDVDFIPNSATNLIDLDKPMNIRQKYIQFKKQGITHIIWNINLCNDSVVCYEVLKEYLKGYLRLIYKRNNVLLFRIDYDKLLNRDKE